MKKAKKEDIADPVVKEQDYEYHQFRFKNLPGVVVSTPPESDFDVWDHLVKEIRAFQARVHSSYSIAKDHYRGERKH